MSPVSFHGTFHFNFHNDHSCEACLLLAHLMMSRVDDNGDENGDAEVKRNTMPCIVCTRGGIIDVMASPRHQIDATLKYTYRWAVATWMDSNDKKTHSSATLSSRDGGDDKRLFTFLLLLSLHLNHFITFHQQLSTTFDKCCGCTRFFACSSSQLLHHRWCSNLVCLSICKLVSSWPSSSLPSWCGDVSFFYLEYRNPIDGSDTSSLYSENITSYASASYYDFSGLWFYLCRNWNQKQK